MVLSVNTNQGAFLALQNLTQTTKQLEVTQLRVTTGLRVNGPKDDASTFAIANTLRGTIAGNQALKIALANGESTSNVAIQAGKAIAEILTEMKAKVVQANQAGLDSDSRTALQNDYNALRNQIQTIVATAEFNSVNLIKTGGTNLAVLSTVDGSTITVTAQDLSVTALGDRLARQGAGVGGALARVRGGDAGEGKEEGEEERRLIRPPARACAPRRHTCWRRWRSPAGRGQRLRYQSSTISANRDLRPCLYGPRP